MSAADKSKKARPRDDARSAARRKRTQERHDRNRAENEARHRANVDSGKYRTPKPRWTEHRVNIKLTALESFYAYVPERLARLKSPRGDAS